MRRALHAVDVTSVIIVLTCAEDDHSETTGGYQSMLDMIRFQQLLKQAEQFRLGLSDTTSAVGANNLEQGKVRSCYLHVCRFIGIDIQLIRATN